jgi:hypothetical protein
MQKADHARPGRLFLNSQYFMGGKGGLIFQVRRDDFGQYFRQRVKYLAFTGWLPPQAASSASVVYEIPVSWCQRFDSPKMMAYPIQKPKPVSQ